MFGAIDVWLGATGTREREFGVKRNFLFVSWEGELEFRVLRGSNGNWVRIVLFNKYHTVGLEREKIIT